MPSVDLLDSVLPKESSVVVSFLKHSGHRQSLFIAPVHGQFSPYAQSLQPQTQVVSSCPAPSLVSSSITSLSKSLVKEILVA